MKGIFNPPGYTILLCILWRECMLLLKALSLLMTYPKALRLTLRRNWVVKSGRELSNGISVDGGLVLETWSGIWQLRRLILPAVLSVVTTSSSVQRQLIEDYHIAIPTAAKQVCAKTKAALNDLAWSQLFACLEYYSPSLLLLIFGNHIVDDEFHLCTLPGYHISVFTGRSIMTQ